MTYLIMAAVGFGFSDGDFISGVGIVRKLIRALNDTVGSRASYQQLISELLDLDQALNQASSLQVNSALAQQSLALQETAGKCKTSIGTFMNNNAKFEKSLGPQPSASALESVWNKLQWALCKDSAISELRRDCSLYSNVEPDPWYHATVSSLSQYKVTRRHLGLTAKLCRSATQIQIDSLSGCRQLLQSVEHDM